jgi:hypothetical protein
MSDEIEALAPLRAKKNSSIASYVKLWNSFHYKLENNTKQGYGLFCCHSDGVGDLSDDVYIDSLLEKALRRSSPNGFCGTSEHARRNRKREAIPMFRYWLTQTVASPYFYLAETERCGMGIFAKRDVTFGEIQRSLVGWLSPISTEDYEVLNKLHYPSMFHSKDGHHYIFIGPLSLVNHRCSAQVAFGDPRPNIVVDALAFTRNDDAQTIQLMDMSGASRRRRSHPGWKKGEEILVCYDANAFDECACDDCYEPLQKKRHVTDDDDDDDD